jgi:hypothetical protein
MKSPETLIKKHERLIRILEMIKDADRRFENKTLDAINYWRQGIWWIVDDCKLQAIKYKSISEYLRTRYINSLKNL